MRLLERDGQTQSELLTAVGLDHSTVSKSRRRMQEAGFLTSEPADHDRRVVRVSLTHKGRAMRGDLVEMWSELERASIGGLDRGTVEEFIGIAQAIRQTIVDRDQPVSNPARRAVAHGGGQTRNQKAEVQI
jgi:MarR family transcriptional regulator, organic hydroperoxide resistance regulator